ncbi:MAG: hypothetical protein ACFFCW_49290, partial [Candidatus Hodarchaeota archaeon]
CSRFDVAFSLHNAIGLVLKLLQKEAGTYQSGRRGRPVSKLGPKPLILKLLNQFWKVFLCPQQLFLLVIWLCIGKLK